MANQYEKLAERFSPRGGQQHPEMPTNLQECADPQALRASIAGRWLDAIEDDAAGVPKTNSTAVKQPVGLGSSTMTWPDEWRSY